MTGQARTIAEEDRLGGGRDDIYVALIEAHAGLSEEQSARLNARLILLLANEVGDSSTLKAAIARARRGLAAE